MARKTDDLADSFATEDSGGWLARFVADEDEFDHRAKWRLGAWAAGSVGALVIAILASQTPTQTRRAQLAAADLAKQSQLIEQLAKQSESETSRLASAINTLNSDRDRLFSRLGSLEQGLDSVTGSIARVQAGAPITGADKPATTSSHRPPAKGPVESSGARATPSIAAVETTALPSWATTPAEIAPSTSETAVPPVAKAEVNSVEVKHEVKADADKVAAVTPLMPARSILAPPDSATTPLLQPSPAKKGEASAAPEADEAETDDAEVAAIPVQRTQFGVDLGYANSIEGLRSLWSRLSHGDKPLASLQPIMMIKERENGRGTQLRLVAGPLDDAAAAAKLCARLSAGKRFCEPAVYDGQRLPNSVPAPAPRPARRKMPPKLTSNQPEPPPPPAPAPTPPPPPKQPSLTTFFGLR
ncbi:MULTISPECIES: SPOR domain-containing protein [Rhodopseudomonas]|uniref:SPOR domain-containing protein n=1 Tax=Rhodopseudomonas palustris TaxID=1076 RepID=A0A0D7F058_RHOPL|nr:MULTISPECIES: SPOR domain-containing protein [Rhodopseudomonas]KIZ46483.1 hypothetical protein OO17_06530 [Rhodopseudomonas palustris]MDF3814465.1 SPOR domain-containing protein [Rhodopseudomonas sp. BAL398]WOK18872.1 SPOR domain-containing protein [Rhodopseudomonas sp. BAL398]